jgi:3-oxoacyl-[acyl-carrier protein] reductase
METDMTVGLSADQLSAIRRRSALLDLVSPDKVAGAVAYLMGPDGAATTGTTLTVDAGSTA